MRKFYLTYKDRTPPIAQTVSAQSALPFALSWAHYVFLLSLENSDERNFYEIEVVSQGWSLRELKRQFNSSLYERLALSRDKDKVQELAR